MHFVLLKTDLLFFLLLAAAGMYALYASRHEHLRAPWREVARQPFGMGAAVVLLAYLLIAVLDSIHFLPAATATAGGPAGDSSDVTSVFDVAVAPLRHSAERTYSVPFATEAYAKETVELADGSTMRAYPRLEHGGAHLRDPVSERVPDIAARVIFGVAGGLAGAIVLAALMTLLWAWHRREAWSSAAGAILRGDTTVSWRVVFTTLGALGVLLGSAIELTPYYHVFGTDQVGNDVLYQALKSVRTGLLIGTLTTLVMLPFAVVLGLAAGYFGGWVDDVIQYLYTTLSSIPGVLLVAAAALMLEVYMAKQSAAYTSLVMRADLRLLALCLILGVTAWTGLCRYLRGEALKLRTIEYIDAARAFGVRHAVILARHIVPNIMHIVMISIVLDFSGLVLAEAALTYIDIGVDPSMESWGNMINGARLELAREPVVWWSLAAAFVFMFGLVLAANLFADAVRDAFDPRLRDGR